MSQRLLATIGFFICAASLGAAYYVEYQYALAPCPLCELQRVAYYSLGFVFLIGAIFKLSSYWRYIYITLAEIFAVAGFLLSARQVWLQYYAPPQIITCSASLQRLMEIYPIFDALKFALTNSSDCAKIDLTILGISVAGWSFILFGLFMVLIPYFFYRQKKGGL